MSDKTERAAMADTPTREPWLTPAEQLDRELLRLINETRAAIRSAFVSRQRMRVRLRHAPGCLAAPDALKGDEHER